LRTVTDDLLTDGVSKFVEPFTKLLRAVERRSREANTARINSQSHSLPSTLHTKVTERLKAWEADGGTRRLFAGDASLWTGTDEASWIGWLGIVDQQKEGQQQLLDLQREVYKEGFTQAVLLGMGGSSLCPEVWKETFGRIAGFPELFVLDSTDPAQIRALEARVDLARTLFIVSSKSGSTLEPNIFKAHFFDRVKQAVGADNAGSRFIAVSDPGSNLEKEARADGFRHIYAGVKSIGGRYSALSNFGMVPAAVMGLDVDKLLDEAERMLHACAPGVPVDDNPGLVLGTIPGCGSNTGRRQADPHLVARHLRSRRLAGAAHRRVHGQGRPRNHSGRPRNRRRAVGLRKRSHLHLPAAGGRARRRTRRRSGRVGESRQAGYHDPRGDEGRSRREFVRWEIATAIAGAVMGINPFNQPDVEASKIATKLLTSEYEKTGKLPSEAPFFEGEGVKLFADPTNADALKRAVGSSRSLTSFLHAHLARLDQGDYFALLAYVEMNATHEAVLQRARHRVRDRKTVATCLGFGPRFLHSTGQAYKGGPDSGVFLQVTCEDGQDLRVPGQKYTFGLVKAAQARGDFQVLAERHRRALRIHLGPDVPRRSARARLSDRAGIGIAALG
jgi:transaldolase/glucose-6-phosphate isomerase